jgi:hypothetical protein
MRRSKSRAHSGKQPAEKRSQVSHPLGGGQAELSGMAADDVGQLRAIADQPVPYADQHQGRLRFPTHRKNISLFLSLDLLRGQERLGILRTRTSSWPYQLRQGTLPKRALSGND